MQRPPCSVFAAEGGGEQAAAAAAADGDCSMEPTRQQQETWGVAEDQTPKQEEPQRQPQRQQPSKGNPAAQTSSQQGHPSEQHDADQQQLQPAHPGAQDQPDNAAAHQPVQNPAQPTSAEQSPEQQQQQQQAPAGGLHNGSTPAARSRASSVAVGMVVSAAAVASIGLAVALLQVGLSLESVRLSAGPFGRQARQLAFGRNLLLPLQPGTRDRIRSMFAKAGRYSTLEEQDPEGGASSVVVPAPGGFGGSELPSSAAIELTGDRAAPLEAQRNLSQSPIAAAAVPPGGSAGPT